MRKTEEEHFTYQSHFPGSERGVLSYTPPSSKVGAKKLRLHDDKMKEFPALGLCLSSGRRKPNCQLRADQSRVVKMCNSCFEAEGGALSRCTGRDFWEAVRCHTAWRLPTCPGVFFTSIIEKLGSRNRKDPVINMLRVGHWCRGSMEGQWDKV